MYYGVGVRLLEYRRKDDDENHNLRVGVRLPIGIAYRTTNPDLEIFGELAAILDVAPRTDVTIDAGIGVRFIF